MTYWRLDPIFGSYALPLAILAVLGGLLWLRPTFRRLSRGRLAVLSLLRCLVILLLVTAMLRPSRISSSTTPQSAVLVLLADQSRSMQLPHVSGGQSRWEAQRSAWERAGAALAALPPNVELRAYTYDGSLHPLDTSQGRMPLPEQPLGEQTDIGTSLSEAVRREAGKRLAAVILTGDGTQTAFEPSVEVFEAGRELARLDYPLFSVAFGPAGDTSDARDLAIENLPEQYTVFAKNEVVIRAQLRVRGYVNQDLPVQLTLEDLAGGPPQQLAAISLRVPADDQLARIEIPHVAELPGQYKLTLAAPPQPGELVVKNNALTSYLTVLEGGVRVLYLYGDLVGEQRLLRRSLNESAEIELDDLFVDPRGRERWPLNLREYLTPPVFDALLLENVHAAALGDEQLASIARAVEQGRGLLMLGGFHSFGPGGYGNTPLANALPLTIGRFEQQEFGYDREISRDLHWWDPLPLRATRPHPVTQLAAPEENAQAWQQLPPLIGANKFAAIQERAQVLLESPDGAPLLVASEYGQGRVLAFAGNSTSRWWQYGFQPAHRRFWRQVILWLTQREDAGQHDVWIRLPQRRLLPGSSLTFEVGARSPAGDPLLDAQFQVEAASPDGSRRAVSLARSGDQLRGVLENLQLPGDYQLEVIASRDGKPLGRARADFQVLDRDVELSHPAADHDLLARLADMTKNAGGKGIAPEELPDLIREIAERPARQQVAIQSKWRLGDTAADAWLFFAVVVSLLTAEWALRKKWGLV